MNSHIWFVMSFMALSPALIFNAFATLELIDYPLYTPRQKMFWLIFLWLVPYAGFRLVHKKLGIERASGKNTGGGDTINVADGGSGGGDCGHGDVC